MSIQPEWTPEQQALRDAIQAWRDGCGIPLPQWNYGRIGVAKTNGPGLAPETVLATPIRHNEQEDYPAW